MRSIRRSLLGYLLVLLALSFGAVALFVDRFANDAIRAREEAESRRIVQVYEARRKDALKQFDEELIREARILGGELQLKLMNALGPVGGRGGPNRPPEPPRPPDQVRDFPGRATEDEVKEYARRAAALLLRPPAPSLWPTLPATAATTRTGGNAAWLGFESPRAASRPLLLDSIRKLLDEDDHVGRSQVTVVASYPGRPRQLIGVARPTRHSQEFPLDLTRFEDPNFEYAHGDVETETDGRYRWVVTPAGLRGTPLAFPIWMPYQVPLPNPVPGQPATLFQMFSQRQGRPPDFWIRLVIHFARPHSELDARLAAEVTERDAELLRVQDETRQELSQLRGRLGLIAGGSFVALTLGGLFIVGRGLSPIRKLSDAVSLVSEKDFRLPVEPGELSGELAPIHARLTQTLDQLRRAFAREKEAVADISHELRTPIASLLATIDVALRKPRTPEQYRLTLDECRVITRQLSQLVERIMTLANLDAGNARTTAVRTDAAEIAAGCAAVMRPIAANVGLTLHVDADGPLELDTDPDKLHEVLINLLHNAVEYNRPDGRVELVGRREGDRVVLLVRDTGIGMTPEVRERIFERFFRADPSRQATGVHAGLGLAIVKEYIERLNGTIAVESEPGVGTTFRVAFPAAPVEAAPPTPVVGPKSRKLPLGSSS